MPPEEASFFTPTTILALLLMAMMALFILQLDRKVKDSPSIEKRRDARFDPRGGNGGDDLIS
jgi:hypothetical protein